MSEINLQHTHALSAEQARAAVEQVAETLRTRFGLACHWQGERLLFKRAGVDGEIALIPGELRVKATLGFLFSALKPQIEQDIRRVLRERF